MYSDFAINKYLRTVASGWIFINIESQMCYAANTVINVMMDFEMQGEYDTGFSYHYLFIAATKFQTENHGVSWRFCAHF